MKNLFTQPRTPAQIIIIHSAESATLSALLTIMVAAIQYAATNGLNWGGLAAVLGTSFVAQMAMVYKSLAANPQTAQALSDTVRQVLSQVVPPAQPVTASVAHVDVPALAQQLKDELVKLTQNQQPPMPETPTRPLDVVKPSTLVPPGVPGGVAIPSWMQKP